MNFTSKNLKTINYFILYDLNDDLVCYYDNFKELSNHITQRLHDLVYEYNRHKSNVIIIEIDRKKYKLATFC